VCVCVRGCVSACTGVCSCACLCVRVCMPCIGMWVCGCVCRYMRKTEYRVRLLRKPRDGVQLHVTLAAHYRPSAAESVSYEPPPPPPSPPPKKIFWIYLYYACRICPRWRIRLVKKKYTPRRSSSLYYPRELLQFTMRKV